MPHERFLTNILGFQNKLTRTAPDITVMQSASLAFAMIKAGLVAIWE